MRYPLMQPLACRHFPTALILAAASLPAGAQTDAGNLMRDLERQQQRRSDRLPEIEAPTVRPTLKPGAGVGVVARSVRFSGATDLASEADLQAVVAHAIGQTLDFGGIEQLARSVTEFLLARGWFLAEAYLPQQDVTDGHIEIAVRPGRLDGQTGRGVPYRILPGKQAMRIDAARLDAIAAAHLRPGAAAHEGDMERTLLLMNDLPGVSAKARLEAGTEAGSTRVLIDVEEGALVSGNAGVDNYGNRDTGSAQANVAVQLNDPAGAGDQASALATHAHGLDLARLAYVMPVGSDGLKFGAALTTMDYRILRGTGLTAGLKGSSQTAGLTLAYPWLRSRSRNLHGTLGYQYKAFKDDSTAGPLKDKRIDVWNAGVAGDALDGLGGGGLTSWNLGWSGGRVDLARVATDLTADAAGYATQGRYDKFGYGAARLQKLPESFTLFANFSGQRAGKNLDSSEKFLLGGPFGVRAYPGSEASGDSGWLANVELRFDLPAVGELGQIQLVGFYDTGRIELHDDARSIAIPTATGRNVYSLSGYGLGVNLTKTGSHALRLGWAGKIGDNPGRSAAGLDADSRADKSRVWFQGMFWFTE